jgi:hypothetical protein
MTTHLPPQACLSCGYVMDRHAQVAERSDPIAVPKPGDFTLCFRCGFVMAYDNKLEFRHLTPLEVTEVEQDKRVQAAIMALADVHKQSRQ